MNIIIEQPIINDKVEILQESTIGKFDTVKFKALLMEADTVNQNRRIYPRHVLEESIERFIKPKLQDRNFGGELDHPIPTGSQADIFRQQTLLYKELSHIITDIWWEGNKVYGIVETTPTPNGEILANLVRFGVKVGFSLRALGDVKPRPSGISEVISPLRIVAIDAVQNPSFQRAAIVETIQESVLLESTQPTGSICADGICFETIDEFVHWRLYKRLNE